MTLAEKRLWYALRAGRLGGLHFRRQVPVAGYIVDFACHERRLIVEVDGATLSTDAERRSDAIRTGRLEEEGYCVVRFWNDDVARDLNGVLETILVAPQPESSGLKVGSAQRHE